MQMVSIQSQVNDFIEKNPDADQNAILGYFLALKFNKQTVHSAIYRYRKRKAKIAKGYAKKKKRGVGSQFQATSTISRNTDFQPKKFKSKKDAEKDFVEFVGFRGYYDKKGYPVVDVSHIIEEVEIRDEDGELISIEIKRKFHHSYHEGEAQPKPIDEKDNIWGILPHEVEGFHKIRKYLKTGIMFKWFRGGGKTYLATWFIEWSMDRLAYPWLYLSETAIMNDVAFWVWQWAKKSKQVVKSEKGDKQNTYTQFELRNGGILRIFSYLDEKSTGQHGWYLAFDDIIKKKWSEKPSEVKKAKNQWNFNLRYIRKKGLMIFGTRKFIGDPLEHLEIMIPQMYIDIMTPYVMKGKFPTWEPVIDPLTGREIISVPELYTWEEIEQKKFAPTEDGEDPMTAFQAEMMQNPMPSAGKRWPDGPQFVKQLEHMNYYDICFFFIDRATTMKETSDYTGFIQGYRRKQTGVRIITNDWTDHIYLEKLLFDIAVFIDIEHRKWEHMSFVVIAEAQGGGDDFEESIYMRSDFEWEGKIIHNWIREIAHVHTFSSTGDKKKRIKDRLGAPIDNGAIKIMEYLKNSEIVSNIFDFPYCNKIDAIDAEATGDWNLMLIYPVVKEGDDYIDNIIKVYQDYEKGVLDVPEMKEGSPTITEEQFKFGKKGKTQKKTVFP